MNKQHVIIITAVIMLASIIFGALAYPQLPETAVSHWDERGNPSGYMSRFWLVALLPLLTLGLTALLLFLTDIDPLHKNIAIFQGEYYRFIVFFDLFLLYVHILSIVWNLGYRFDFARLIAPGLGLFIFFTGSLVEKARRNYFIGIRTPWTLSSDLVWDKTHRLGGKLFKASGLLTLAGLFFPEQSMFNLLLPLLGSSLFLFLYSYLLFKKENLSGKPTQAH